VGERRLHLRGEEQIADQREQTTVSTVDPPHHERVWA
jgi:hypothetical protein